MYSSYVEGFAASFIIHFITSNAVGKDYQVHTDFETYSRIVPHCKK